MPNMKGGAVVASELGPTADCFENAKWCLVETTNEIDFLLPTIGSGEKIEKLV